MVVALLLVFCGVDEEEAAWTDGDGSLGLSLDNDDASGFVALDEERASVESRR